MYSKLFSREQSTCYIQLINLKVYKFVMFSKCEQNLQEIFDMLSLHCKLILPNWKDSKSHTKTHNALKVLYNEYFSWQKNHSPLKFSHISILCNTEQPWKEARIETSGKTATLQVISWRLHFLVIFYTLHIRSNNLEIMLKQRCQAKLFDNSFYSNYKITFSIRVLVSYRFYKCLKFIVYFFFKRVWLITLKLLDFAFTHRESVCVCVTHSSA